MSKLSQYEKKFGIIATDRKKYPDTLELTDKEWDKLYEENWKDFSGVNHDDRIKFLKDNGYAVTHENMLNPELSAKPKPNKE